MDRPPEWDLFEEVQPPSISWRRAKRAIATTTSTREFVTISSWESNARWIYGSHHNEQRVRRLCSTQPHGFDADGDPWYTAVLYPAPPDPIYQIYDLVGLATWVGRIGCLWPGYYSKLMMPLVQALGRQSKHFTVPVFFGSYDDRPGKPLVLLPRAEEMRRLLHHAEQHNLQPKASPQPP